MGCAHKTHTKTPIKNNHETTKKQPHKHTQKYPQKHTQNTRKTPTARPPRPTPRPGQLPAPQPTAQPTCILVRWLTGGSQLHGPATGPATALRWAGGPRGGGFTIWPRSNDHAALIYGYINIHRFNIHIDIFLGPTKAIEAAVYGGAAHGRPLPWGAGRRQRQPRWATKTIACAIYGPAPCHPPQFLGGVIARPPTQRCSRNIAKKYIHIHFCMYIHTYTEYICTDINMYIYIQHTYTYNIHIHIYTHV